MSQEIKEQGFLNKPTSRREFLKFGCKSIAGAAVSMSILSLFTDSTSAEGFPTASGLLIAEINRCTGCRRCETTCTVTNDGKAQPYISRIKVGRNYNFGPDGPKRAFWNEDGQYGNFAILPDTCKQCKDPVPCASACPMGAIGADPHTKARVVNEDKCVGCGMCAAACPWSVITVDPEEKKAKKCFLCDGDPQCVQNCPTGALRLIPWKEVRATLRARRYYA